MELEGTSIAHDQHYTVSELAKRWHLSPNTVRRLVVDEPGVIKLTVGPLLRNRRKRHPSFAAHPRARGAAHSRKAVWIDEEFR